MIDGFLHSLHQRQLHPESRSMSSIIIKSATPASKVRRNCRSAAFLSQEKCRERLPFPLSRPIEVISSAPGILISGKPQHEAPPRLPSGSQGILAIFPHLIRTPIVGVGRAADGADRSIVVWDLGEGGL